MTTEITSGKIVAAATLPLTHEPLDPSDVLSGEPTTGSAELGVFGETEVGVWEITPGVSTDVETDEVFIVLKGSATIAFAEGDLSDITVGPGDVVRLDTGMRTTWTVHETLRKIYLM